MSWQKGDKVRWNTSQGETHGKVVDVKTSDFSIEGTDLKASKDDPRIVVESDKSGKRAAHRPDALKKA
jgi:Hypervirulence associated proteins TUDOR domain